MPLEPGTKLGSYEILSAVKTEDGSELYSASDTQSKGEVTIQVIPGPLSERLEREAMTVAALHHPNICALLDVGHHNGGEQEGDVHFLVLEQLDGKTLAQRLEKGPLDLKEAVALAIAIADALDQSHRQGVTHRDLNPSKVLLTGNGPKLLDFGLSEPKPLPVAAPGPKAIARPGSDVDIQYLSPEQLEGKDPDARSDIFAFGSILYEMVTGKRAFEGKSRAVLIAAIATADPDPLSPPWLQHIVERCLAKDPNDRWQTAHDLLLQLRWVAEGAVGSGPGRTRENLVRIVLAVAALLIAALALPAARYLKGPGDPEPFQFRVPVRGLSTADIALSPDGEIIALVARPNSGDVPSLFVRRTGSVAFTKLGGTDDATQPFWSPDSRFIGFVGGGRLKQVSAAGGAPKDIAPVQGFSGGAWNKDGTILFGSVKGVYRVSAEGGNPSPVTTLDAQESGHFWPSFLPDGKHFLYLAWSAQPANRAVFVGTLDSKEKKRLMAAESNTQYAEPGYVVFHREASLFAQKFDPKKLVLSGDPLHLADQVASSPADGHGVFDVSENGSVLYFQGTNSVTGRGGLVNGPGGAPIQFGWVDRSGRPVDDGGEQGNYGDLDASPDGKLIAITKQDAAAPTTDIWVIDWQRAGVATRLTNDPADDFNPVWAPDGKHIAFTTYRKGNADIYVVENGNGAAKDTPLLETTADEFVEDWSKDGKYIAYLTGEEGFHDVWALALGPDGKPDPAKKPFAVVEGHFQKNEPQFSYDTKWLAYTSDRTVPGTFQVYVRSFPAGDQEIAVSTAGGGQPRWKKDGKELYYRAPDGNVMVIEIKTAPKLEASIPRVLFRPPFDSSEAHNPTRHAMSVTGDGQRFLLRVAPGGNRAAAVRRSATNGNLGVPEAPRQANTPSSASPGAAGGRGGGGGAPVNGVNGLTVIQHWTSALAKAEK